MAAQFRGRFKHRWSPASASLRIYREVFFEHVERIREWPYDFKVILQIVGSLFIPVVVVLIQVPVQVLGHGAELDEQVCRKILRYDFAPLLSPQPVQGGFYAFGASQERGRAELGLYR